MYFETLGEPRNSGFLFQNTFAEAISRSGYTKNRLKRSANETQIFRLKLESLDPIDNIYACRI